MFLFKEALNIIFIIGCIDTDKKFITRIPVTQSVLGTDLSLTEHQPGVYTIGLCPCLWTDSYKQLRTRYNDIDEPLDLISLIYGWTGVFNNFQLEFL